MAGITLVPAGIVPASAQSPTDWSAYLFGAEHSSYNAADTAITTANAATLVKKWHWSGPKSTMPGQPWPGLFSSPTVVDGAVYIGADNGDFYKIDEATGTVLAQVFIGYQPKLTCYGRGFISTATVAPDPVTGNLTVYVAAPDGYLYALSAADLSVVWRSVIAIPSTTQNDYFNWSSPTVANGMIYIGSASNCDKPLTQGFVASYDQETGNQIAKFFTVPSGYLGGGVWSSVAVDGQGNVYASTGTQPKNTTSRFDSVSIIKLNGQTLALEGAFTVPDSQLKGDSDFGGSPTLFDNDQYVGACNKNGYYYALSTATMQVAWEDKIGAGSSRASPAQCSAAAIWNGSDLFMAGDATTIGGVNYHGSIEEIDPATGAYIWQTGLPNSALGSPTMNGSGVMGVGTYDYTSTPNAVYLINSSTGKIIRTLNTGGYDFAQPVFADGLIFTANSGKGLTEYGLPS